MKRKAAIGVVVFILTGLAFYFLTIVATPYVILYFLSTRSPGGLNQPVYSSVITEKDREVVMPNPDFLYVIAGYDLREGPVRITGMMPGKTYGSVALYTFNTRNYFVKNDAAFSGGEVDILLYKIGQSEYIPPGTTQPVLSPSNYGVMLVRILIDDPGRIEELKAVQKSFKMEKVEDAPG